MGNWEPYLIVIASKPVLAWGLARLDDGGVMWCTCCIDVNALRSMSTMKGEIRDTFRETVDKICMIMPVMLGVFGVSLAITNLAINILLDKRRSREQQRFNKLVSLSLSLCLPSWPWPWLPRPRLHAPEPRFLYEETMNAANGDTF